jgi:hypothetical protein
MSDRGGIQSLVAGKGLHPRADFCALRPEGTSVEVPVFRCSSNLLDSRAVAEVKVSPLVSLHPGLFVCRELMVQIQIQF